MACFDDEIVISDPSGRTMKGLEEVRRHYESAFELVPDGRCELRTVVGQDGRGVGESVFHGTLQGGQSIDTVGAEVMELSAGKITAIRDYHRPVNE